MKSYLLASISTLALVGAAAAADMPVRPMTKAPMAPVMAPTWTGPYVGLNLGAIRTSTRFRVYEFDDLTYDPGLRKTGVTLGGQIGHNWQVNNFVYGVEADLNWSNARTSRTAEALFGGEFGDFSTRLSWFGTVRGRIGFTTSPTLYYLTGGVAFAGIRNHANIEDGTAILNSRGTRTGWTVGGGIEHMLTHNTSVKAEVLYMDFGRKSATDDIYTGRFKNTAVVGRVGVNVRW